MTNITNYNNAAIAALLDLDDSDFHALPFNIHYGKPFVAYTVTKNDYSTPANFYTAADVAAHINNFPAGTVVHVSSVDTDKKSKTYNHRLVTFTATV